MSDIGYVDTTGFDLPVAGHSLLGQIPGALAFGVGNSGDTPLAARPAAAAAAALQTKYRNLGPVLQQLPPDIANALINYDAGRVARGGLPLNDAETTSVVQTALTGAPATPAPRRSILNLPGNAIHDIGDIVRSIPRLPSALVHEVTQIPHIGDSIAQASAAGANPIAALAQAPGIRLIPGAYTVGQIASGAHGLRELVTHPVLTALDLIPAANEAAKLTAVGRIAGEEAAAVGRTAQPLRSFLTRRVGEDGALEARAVPALLGDARDNTRLGQAFDARFGGRVRSTMRAVDEAQQHLGAVNEGSVTAANETEATARAASSIMERHPLVTADEGPGLWRRARLGDYDGMTAPQLAFLNDFRDVQGRLQAAKVGDGLVGEVSVDGSREVYDRSEYERYQGLAAHPTTIRRKAFMRSEVENPTLPVEAYVQAIRDAGDTRLFGKDAGEMTVDQRSIARSKGIRSRADAVGEARAAQHALGTLGFNVDELNRAITSFKNGDAGALADAADRFLADRPIADPKQLASNEAATARFSDRYSKFDEKAATRAAQRADRYLTRTPPARFKPLVEDQVRQLTEQSMQASGLDVLDAAEQKLIVADATATWRQLKARGIDPTFVHQVPVNRLGQALRPGVSEVAPAISSLKTRAINGAPAIQDLGISLSHEANELLRRPASEQLAARIGDMHGINQAELIQRVRPAADRILARTGLVDDAGAMQQAINRGWTKFDTVQGYNWGSPILKRFADEQVWVPNSVAKALRDIRGTESPLAIFDPITKTFRTSVVGLSVRTHLNNAIGGAIMATGEGGFGVWKHAQQAWDLMRNPELADPALGRQLGQANRLFADLDADPVSARALGIGEYLKGRTLGRLWDESMVGKLGIGRKLGDIAQRSMEMNGKVDNLFRAMTYLRGKELGLGKGLTEEASIGAGLELARKAMMDWSGMTPFERSIMKSVIPFYGFTRHILGYAMRYPIDHPLRASIIGKLGEAEAADHADELGTRWLGSLFLGGPDSQGRVNTLNVDAINPFRDVAHMLTLHGFLGSTNPVIATALQQVGVRGGQAELYPTLRYDPETGRLAASAGNPIVGLLENTIPQSQIVTGLLGLNSQLRDRLRYDPPSALRSIASSAGIPLVWRNINLRAEQFKAELAREKAQADVQKRAITSGDWTRAATYPGLDRVHAALQALTPAQRQVYAPISPATATQVARGAAGITPVDVPGASGQGL